MKIKIRAWDRKTKCMRGTDGVKDLFSIRSDGECHKDFVLMQFTGLTDATGAEIYEGDFVQDVITVDGVKHELPIQEVVWVNEWSCFGLVPGNPYEFNHLTFSEHRRIVGNRFENPELLTEEKK